MDDILDLSGFHYAVGEQQFSFRVPRLGVLKGAARRNAFLLCAVIDTIRDLAAPGITANDDAIIRAAVDFMLDTDMGEEVLRDSLRGDPVPDLSKQAQIDILANIVTLSWQMFGTLTLRAEIGNIYAEFRSKGGRQPVRMPAALGSGVRH